MINNKRDITEYECSNMGNQYPICEPTSNDVWYQGSDYKLIWNYNNAYYIVNTPVANNSLDFHLYYQENYSYKPIMQWYDLSLLTGSLTVNVNNSWFPQPADEGQNKTWTMYGWFLPAGRNATQMLLETETTYPRPFNWSVVQTYDPNYTKENPTGANNGNDSNSDSSDNGSGLPGWAIAVIVIACIAFVAALCAIGAVIYLRRRQKQSRQPMTMTEAAAIAAARQNQNQPHQPPPAAGGGTTKSDVGSIYSSTPIIGAAGSHSRGSAASTEGSGSTRHRASPPADSFRNLMYSEWKSRVPPGEQEEEEEELRRRRLGEALLQRELEEEGAAVKHTDRRPMTVAPPEALESKAVVLERQDGKNNHPSPPQ